MSARTPSRRTILKGMGALCSPAISGSAFATWSSRDPFQLGVAAGSPKPDGFVLWTRLAPDPLCADPATPGGMSGASVEIIYEISTDDRLANIVRRGTAIADAQFAYSVHLDIHGLKTGRPYWYRFRFGHAASRIGRAITTPESGSKVDALRFGFVSCSNYEAGYFSAYRHLADEHPDLVIFLGDYIYEDLFHDRDHVRTHSDGVIATDLPTYRNRYAQYRMDPDLQRLHAEVPALMTWDDHEVQNDYADRWSQTFDDPDKFLLRRAAAYQAYYEHMPLRPNLSHPQGPLMRIYDMIGYGDLVNFYMLDGRQYRSREACYGPPAKGGAHLETRQSCAELFDPNRSMIGPDQEKWLFDKLSNSRSRWNILAQDVLMARLRQKTGDDFGYWTDVWDGYPPSRDRLLQHLHGAKIQNPVVLSGDIHSFWTNDLMLDFDDAKSPVVATEFVGTSVSSPGPDYDQFSKFLPANPHVKFFESRKRGYVTINATPGLMTADFKVVSDVTDPRASVSKLRSFFVEDGHAGARAT